MAQHLISRIGLAVTAAAVAVAVSACGQGANSAAPPPAGGTSAPDTSSPSGVPSSDTFAQTTSQPTPGSSDGAAAGAPARGGNGLCKSADLKLSLGGGGGAAGTTYRSLIFTNGSGHPCVIQGFPGVSYVGGDDGHQVGPAAYRDGTKGPAITLNPGESAHATVGFVNVHNYDEATCQPQPVRGLRVYPPQETASIYLEMPSTGCGSDKIPGNQLTVKTIESGTGDGE